MCFANENAPSVLVRNAKGGSACFHGIGAKHDPHGAHLLIGEPRSKPTRIRLFSFLWLRRQTIRHALQNPVERDVLPDRPLIGVVAKRLASVLISGRCRFMTWTEIGVPTFNGRINMPALHAARLTKMSGRNVSRGMLILFSMSTAIGAVTGLAPFTRERAVGSAIPSLSASSFCDMPCSSQYRSSGSQRFFLFTIRSESWN